MQIMAHKMKLFDRNLICIINVLKAIYQQENLLLIECCAIMSLSEL